MDRSEELASLWSVDHSGLAVDHTGCHKAFPNSHQYKYIPKVYAISIFTSRIAHTCLTIRTFPSYFAPTFSWFVAETSGLVTSVTAFGYVTKVTLVTIVTFTFHGFGAVTIMRASGEFNAVIAISTCPSRMATEMVKNCICSSSVQYLLALPWEMAISMMTCITTNGFVTKHSSPSWLAVTLKWQVTIPMNTSRQTNTG